MLPFSTQVVASTKRRRPENGSWLLLLLLLLLLIGNICVVVWPGTWRRGIRITTT